MKIKNLHINRKKIMSFALAIYMLATPSLAKGSSLLDFIDNSTTIEEQIPDISIDEALSCSGVKSQKDKVWKDWGYSRTSNRMTTIGDGGCSPLSITNALSLAFGIDNKEFITELLEDIITLKPRYDDMNNYLLKNNYNKELRYLNQIVNGIDGKIYNGGGSIDSLITVAKRLNELDNDYVFGVVSFKPDNYSKIIKLIHQIYIVNPDANIIFYNMTGGCLELERPFGSISNHGHYVTLFINAREFVENNCIYLIDSLPRNLKGEQKYNANYCFVERPLWGKLKKFNETFIVTRVNPDILKIMKDGKFDITALDLLGLEGGCGVIICPNNLIKKMDLNKNANDSENLFSKGK